MIWYLIVCSLIPAGTTGGWTSYNCTAPKEMKDQHACQVLGMNISQLSEGKAKVRCVRIQ